MTKIQYNITRNTFEFVKFQYSVYRNMQYVICLHIYWLIFFLSNNIHLNTRQSIRYIKTNFIFGYTKKVFPNSFSPTEKNYANTAKKS